MRQAPRDLKKRLETMSVYLCETTSHSAYAKAIITGFFQSVGSNVTAETSYHVWYKFFLEILNVSGSIGYPFRFGFGSNNTHNSKYHKTRSIRYSCRVWISPDSFLSDRIPFEFSGSVYLPRPSLLIINICLAVLAVKNEIHGVFNAYGPVLLPYANTLNLQIQVIDTVERICLEADSSFFPAFGYIIEVLSNHGVDFEAIQVWKTRKNKERDEGTLSPREVALLTNLLGTPIGPAGAILQGQQKSSLLQPGLDVIQGGFLEIEHDFTNQVNWNIREKNTTCKFSINSSSLLQVEVYSHNFLGKETSFEKLEMVESSSHLVRCLTTVFNMKSITADIVNIYGGTSNYGTNDEA
ncbi:hypothetical protein YC2023_005993 [Brassica napus]